MRVSTHFHLKTKFKIQDNIYTYYNNINLYIDCDFVFLLTKLIAQFELPKL